MHILAFDTCLDGVSVAVARADPAGTRVLWEVSERRRAGHAERLLPMIIAALAGAGVGFADLGRIAATCGPGSFTGVRTGIAAARALALAIGCPAVGVGCLAAIACGARAELGEASAGRPLAVALDARLGMVYFQHFDATGEARGAPLLLAPQACAEVLGSAAAIVVGSGAAAVVEARVGAGLQARLPKAEPRASVVAQLAAEAAAGQPLKPLYLRAPDAKPQADRVLPRALS
jgi:tRNA threonylcarbamoyladenosine biosynthesis protein TsaB